VHAGRNPAEKRSRNPQDPEKKKKSAAKTKRAGKTCTQNAENRHLHPGRTESMQAVVWQHPGRNAGRPRQRPPRTNYKSAYGRQCCSQQKPMQVIQSSIWQRMQ